MEVEQRQRVTIRLTAQDLNTMLTEYIHGKEGGPSVPNPQKIRVTACGKPDDEMGDLMIADMGQLDTFTLELDW